MERFYKMWLNQLHHHVDLLNSPSQSVATFSPQGPSQTALKKSPEPVAWSTEVLLPWITLLFMVCWLLYQKWRQAMEITSVHGSPFSPSSVWSSNTSALPNVVPVAYYHS